MAHPVPGTKADAKKLKPRAARAIDFEAPITVTVEGRHAAVLRFAAYLNERTPEEEVHAAIRADALNNLENGFGHTPQSAKEWLTE